MNYEMRAECAERFSSLETSFEYITEMLKRIENKLDDSIKKNDEALDELKDDMDSNSEKIRKLENWQTWISGACAVVGAFAYGVWDYIKKKGII